MNSVNQKPVNPSFGMKLGYDKNNPNIIKNIFGKKVLQEGLSEVEKFLMYKHPHEDTLLITDISRKGDVDTISLKWLDKNGKDKIGESQTLEVPGGINERENTDDKYKFTNICKVITDFVMNEIIPIANKLM